MDVRKVTEIGDPRIAATLRAFIGALEGTFPDRVRAVYLSGTYVTNTPTPGSTSPTCAVAPSRSAFR